MPTSGYHVYLHSSVASELQLLRKARKREILNIDQLEADPFIIGDFKKPLRIRELEVKVIGRYAVYYYADHATKEVKVVELLQFDH